MISYAPRSGGSCPNCGAPVNLLPADVNGSDPARRLDALLRLTRELLDVDVAMLSEIAGGREVVINTQRAVHQVWVAAQGHGLHFGWDETRQGFFDDKGQGLELLAFVAGVLRDEVGVDLHF